MFNELKSSNIRLISRTIYYFSISKVISLRRAIRNGFELSLALLVLKGSAVSIICFKGL